MTDDRIIAADATRRSRPVARPMERQISQAHRLGRGDDRGDLLLLPAATQASRSEEHTSELQSLMRISYAVFCLKKKKKNKSRGDCYDILSYLSTANSEVCILSYSRYFTVYY